MAYDIRTNTARITEQQVIDAARAHQNSIDQSVGILKEAVKEVTGGKYKFHDTRYSLMDPSIPNMVGFITDEPLFFCVLGVFMGQRSSICVFSRGLEDITLQVSPVCNGLAEDVARH